MSSMVFGNFAMELIVTKTTGPSFFMIMSSLALVGALMNNGLKIPKSSENLG